MKEKEEISVTKESDSCQSESTVLMVKKNVYKDFALKSDMGRLINTSTYENLFKKLSKGFDKTSLLKQKVKLYKDKLI